LLLGVVLYDWAMTEIAEDLMAETYGFLVHGQVTIIFVVSVCLFVCLFVQPYFSAVFDPISVKLEHMLCVWL